MKICDECNQPHDGKHRSCDGCVSQRRRLQKLRRSQEYFDCCEASDAAKEERIRIYAEMAERGIPLFN